MVTRYVYFTLLFFVSLSTFQSAGAAVTVSDKGVRIDGKDLPFLYGAEVQYFRARGGPGRNVPVATVEALWESAIDRVLEAKMNTVIFYIPWDFHEPAEGIFDFDGKLDRDGDGNPDYPSRNLRGFLKLLRKRGVKHVMIRPGPYINAEWGPEGFGAVPRWFLDQYPEALMKNQAPNKPRVAAFGNATFRRLSERWMRTLHREVLNEFLGAGSNIQFLQIDNETNYFWDSLYERDWSDEAIGRYRRFIATRYDGSVAKMNAAYGAKLTGFDVLSPPKNPGDGTLSQGAWHYDWYAFHDAEILDYYRFLRGVWESLAVREPNVLFTSCDSYNTSPYGLLPRLDARQGGRLSMTTMNIYPKTFGTAATSTLNTPMKAAHDATLVASSHRAYYGGAGDWVMSSETVGGWFAPTEVTLGARQHTYGSLLGSGVKALIIYYFHEGWNWTGLEGKDTELSFDAPLDKNMKPRAPFRLLAALGNALTNGALGSLVADSSPLRAPVLLAHDSAAQYPVPGPVNALDAASTDAAAVFGWLREAGAEPEIGFLDVISEEELARYKLVVWKSRGYLTQTARKKMERYVDRGGNLLLLGPTDFVAVPGSSGRVTIFSDNPADGWNDDRYTKLTDAKGRLSRASVALMAAGVTPPAAVTVEDGDVFVHSWWRRSGNRLLLFVENFARRDRKVTVRPGAALLAGQKRFDVFRHYGLEGDPLGVPVKENWEEATTSVKLAIPSDSLTVFSFLPRTR